MYERIFPRSWDKKRILSQKSKGDRGMNGYLTKIPPDSENKPLEWVGRMLQHDQGLRPTAQKLMEMITNTRNSQFCGSCCFNSYESSDSDDTPFSKSYVNSSRDVSLEHQLANHNILDHVSPNAGQE